MADITKCSNRLCPEAKNCYRTIAPDSTKQSWAFFEYVIGVDGVRCNECIPVPVGYKTGTVSNY